MRPRAYKRRSMFYSLLYLTSMTDGMSYFYDSKKNTFVYLGFIDFKTNVNAEVVLRELTDLG